MPSPSRSASHTHTQITVCGGGNAAHTLAAVLAARDDLSVSVFLSFEEEARRWQEGLAMRGGIEAVWADHTITGRPWQVSADPSQVIPGAQLVFLALPAFAHEAVLRQIAAYLEPGIWLGAIPARSCFDLCAHEVLKDKVKDLTIFGFQTLPWACRILRYGQAVTVLGTKSRIDLAAWPAGQASQVAAALTDLLGLVVHPVASFLSLTLAGTGQLIHPGIMYGLFHDWDGAPFVEAPLFYQGVDDFTAGVLESLSDEIQSLRAVLEESFPGLDLSAVRPLADWLTLSYQEDIADDSSLMAALNTNRSYAGLRAPVYMVENGYLPDFKARYLAEDVPYGLLASLGVAELAGLSNPARIQVPHMLQVVEWAQQYLEKEYIVEGRLCGRDLIASRAPQRYQYQSIEQLIRI